MRHLVYHLRHPGYHLRHPGYHSRHPGYHLRHPGYHLRHPVYSGRRLIYVAGILFMLCVCVREREHVCVCARARVCVCVRARVCARARACACVCLCSRVVRMRARVHEIRLIRASERTREAQASSYWPCIGKPASPAAMLVHSRARENKGWPSLYKAHSYLILTGCHLYIKRVVTLCQTGYC